jgi:gluconolactonase
MKRQLRALSSFLLGALTVFGADDYKPGPDSLPQPGIQKGEMLKDKYLAKDGSVFPGTEREYQIYLPAGLDTSKPAPFMVFQDGVIYQAPVVFDNLIAKKEIPPLIGIFIKPGVVPAANDNALPRFNRSYEYDSVTDNYSRFLIDEFLPAIKARHKLNLSDDPNARGIAGSSSGGICAFMVAWHRPDQFRRVFTSVGTYVGIHGADQLPVLVRKYEPKPIRIYLQSGENDNDLYCGDWWMANQMMERSLTWNGYDVNHTWGTGGHNQKHATAILPDVLRWLWKGYPDEPVKANPRGDAKWRGYEVIGLGQDWQIVTDDKAVKSNSTMPVEYFAHQMTSTADGSVWVGSRDKAVLKIDGATGAAGTNPFGDNLVCGTAAHPNGALVSSMTKATESRASANLLTLIDQSGKQVSKSSIRTLDHMAFTISGWGFGTTGMQVIGFRFGEARPIFEWPVALRIPPAPELPHPAPSALAISPDQTLLYVAMSDTADVWAFQITEDGKLANGSAFCVLEGSPYWIDGLCVDTNGWLYVATSLGIQVCDQAGRVNFIIPTPQQPYDVCFGGKDLSELFIACGDTIYKRKTKAHGYISGQMAPIKPPPPKL